MSLAVLYVRVCGVIATTVSVPLQFHNWRVPAWPWTTNYTYTYTCRSVYGFI